MKILCTKGTAGQMLAAFKDKLADLNGVEESTDITEGKDCEECIEDCDAVDTNKPVLSDTEDDYTQRLQSLVYSQDGASIIEKVSVQFNSGGLTVSVDTVDDDHFDLDITDDELSGDPYEDADVVLDAIYDNT